MVSISNRRKIIQCCLTFTSSYLKLNLHLLSKISFSGEIFSFFFFRVFTVYTQKFWDFRVRSKFRFQAKVCREIFRLGGVARNTNKRISCRNWPELRKSSKFIASSFFSWFQSRVDINNNMQHGSCDDWIIYWSLLRMRQRSSSFECWVQQELA